MADSKFEVNKDSLEVRITRTFKATPERMWQAFSDKAQIPQWWGLGKLVVDKHEFKVGGAWRYVETDEHGKKHGFNGEFIEIDEPRKIVRTFEYEPWAGHQLTETITFELQSVGQTKSVMVSKYSNLQDLEGMVGSGMEKGSKIGLDRLANLVE